MGKISGFFTRRRNAEPEPNPVEEFFAELEAPTTVVSLAAPVQKDGTLRKCLVVVRAGDSSRPVKVISFIRSDPWPEVSPRAQFAGNFDTTARSYNRIIKEAAGRGVLRELDKDK